MGSGVFDVGVVNHPSFFTLEEVGRLGRGKRLAIYAAEMDDILPAEKRRATENILTKREVTWMSTIFSETRHGFSVRGDLKVKEVRLAKERAFRGAVEWFRELVVVCHESINGRRAAQFPICCLLSHSRLISVALYPNFHQDIRSLQPLT